MALTANKLIQTAGAPSGGEQVMQSTSWGVDGSGFLNNGVIGLPIVAGTIGYAVVQGAAGQWEYAAIPAPAPVDSVAGKTGVVTLVPADVGLGNVTNDAQLTRAAGDFNSFTSKATPVGADVILIEDSAAGFAKKKILISALPGGGGTPGGSDTQVQYNNAGAFGGMSAMTYNNGTGKIIMNAGAVAGGDVEVLKETTGTVLFIDVSAGDIGVGTDSPALFGAANTYLTVESSLIPTVGMRTTSAVASSVIQGNFAVINSNVVTNAGQMGAFQVLMDAASASNPSSIVRITGRKSANTGINDLIKMTADAGSLEINGARQASFSGSTISLRGESSGYPGIELISTQTDGDDVIMSGIITVGNAGTNNGLRSIIQTRQDGASELGGKILIGTQESSVAGFHTHVVLDRVGKYTHNFAARANADFEVLKQTAGTAWFVDVSTGNASINTDTPDAASLGTNKYCTLHGGSVGGTYEMASSRSDGDGLFIGGFIATFTTITSATKRITGVNFETDGSAANNRGGKILFKTKLDGSTSFNTQTVIGNAGKLTHNFSALAGGDFEVLQESTGTAIFIQASTGKAAIGTNVIDGDARLNVSGTIQSGGLIADGNFSIDIDHDNNSTTNNFQITHNNGTQLFKVQENGGAVFGSGNPDPGGVGVHKYLTNYNAAGSSSFEMASNRTDADNAVIGIITSTNMQVSGSFKRINQILFLTDGATANNRGGKIQFQTKLDGSNSGNTHTQINNAGKLIHNFSALAGGDFEILKSGSGQLALFDVSAGEVFLNLPVSAGTAGSLWNDSGTVKVA